MNDPSTLNFRYFVIGPFLCLWGGDGVAHGSKHPGSETAAKYSKVRIICNADDHKRIKFSWVQDFFIPLLPNIPQYQRDLWDDSIMKLIWILNYMEPPSREIWSIGSFTPCAKRVRVQPNQTHLVHGHLKNRCSNDWVSDSRMARMEEELLWVTMRGRITKCLEVSNFHLVLHTSC